MSYDPLLTTLTRNRGKEFLDLCRLVNDHPASRTLFADENFAALIDELQHFLPQPNPAFRQLHRALRTGCAEQLFPIGTEIQDQLFVNTRSIHKIVNIAWVIADYRKVEQPFDYLEQDEPANGAILYMKEYPDDLDTMLMRSLFNEPQHLVDGSTLYPRSRVDEWLDEVFASYCSSKLLQQVTQVVVRQNNTTDTTTARFFLPSCEELHIDTGDNDVEKAWRYFLDTPTDPTVPCSKRSFGLPIWTRTSDGDIWSEIWIIRSDGSATTKRVRDQQWCIPACVII